MTGCHRSGSFSSSSLSPLIILSVFSPLCGSSLLLMLPVINSIHPQTTTYVFSEHYTAGFPVSKETPTGTRERAREREIKCTHHHWTWLFICLQTHSCTPPPPRLVCTRGFHMKHVVSYTSQIRIEWGEMRQSKKYNFSSEFLASFSRLLRSTPSLSSPPLLVYLDVFS